MKQNQDPARDLSRKDREEIHRRSSIPAVVVHEAIRIEGDAELERPSAALAWSGLAAGLSMGFSLVAEGLLKSYLPDASWSPLISKLGYSLGFLIVILGRQQLFTENTLTPVIPYLMCREWGCLKNLLRLWAVVLATNLIGVFLFAWMIGVTDIFPPEAKAAFTELGLKAVQPGFGAILLKGVFAGWLIAMIVWLMPMAETARVSIIIILTYVVGLGELSHIIAGSAETLYIVVTGEIPFSTYLLGYMLPTLIGNVIGGVALVAALNHAQVVAGTDEEPDYEFRIEDAKREREKRAEAS